MTHLTELQMLFLIIMIVGLLGLNIMAIKNKKMKKNVKLIITLFITSVCYSTVVIIKMSVDVYVPTEDVLLLIIY